jgi:serine protease Do
VIVDPAHWGEYTWGMNTAIPQEDGWLPVQGNLSLRTCHLSLANGRFAVTIDQFLFLRFCVALLLCFGIAGSVRAQSPSALPAALERPGNITPEQRAELQRELEQNAQVLEAQSKVVKIVAKLVGPAVVHIEADIPPDPNAPYSKHREEAGSGVIIELKGKHYVLTNRHVVRNTSPSGIRIRLADGRLFHPATVLEDPDTDVAVMRLSASNLVAAPLGDSDRMDIGDFVLAVGSPFGLSQSVTFGIISAKGRRDLKLSETAVRVQDFLQTDAAINPGNSGGPLVNLHGEVIGINTAIASNSGGNEGIGFAIPVNMFMVVARQLIETGKMTSAFLGVNLNSKFGPATAAELGLPRPVGAQVTSVTPNSAADAAKIEVGDVILEFNHIAVESDAHLVRLVSLTPIGKSVPLLVYRNRKTFTVMVEVGDRTKFEP